MVDVGHDGHIADVVTGLHRHKESRILSLARGTERLSAGTDRLLAGTDRLLAGTDCRRQGRYPSTQ
jgi:hypothetical protein